MVDLGGVLVDSGTKNIKEHLSSTGTQAHAEEIIQHYNNYRKALHLGYVELEQVITNINQRFGTRLNVADFCEARIKDTRINQLVVDTLRNWKNRYALKLLIVLVTDLGKADALWVRQQGFIDIFDDIFISSTTGMVKTQPEYFVWMANKLDIEFNRIALIDDTRENIIAARRAGLHAIQFKSSRSLRVVERLLIEHMR